MQDPVGRPRGAQADVSFCFCFFLFAFVLFLCLAGWREREREREGERERERTKLPRSRPPSLSFSFPSLSKPRPSPQTLTPLPRYVPSPHKANRLAGERLRQSLEPLVDAACFDLVLSGHVHSFARSCNAAGLRCVPRSSGGAVHYTLGCGGRKLSGVESVVDQPSWISAAEDQWGFLRIDADGSGGSLIASFVRARDGSVGDSVVLYAAERPPAHACRGGRNGGERGNASAVAVEVA